MSCCCSNPICIEKGCQGQKYSGTFPDAIIGINKSSYDALKAENALLLAKIQVYHNDLCNAKDENAALKGERDMLLALMSQGRDKLADENQALRAALNWIVNNASSFGLEAEPYVTRAREALNKKD